MNTLFDIFNSIQSNLFPWLEKELDPLSEKEQKFIKVVLLLDLGKHMKEFMGCGVGRKRKNRSSLAKAFVAKAVYNFETTDILIEYLIGCKNLRRLCGWEHRWSVQSKSTFSKAFSEFAEKELLQKIHEAMIKTHYSPKVAGHVRRDSTAIEAHEKPIKKTNSVSITKRKRGRPRKGEKVDPKVPKRLDLQADRSLEDNLSDLPLLLKFHSRLQEALFLSTV